MKVTLGRKIREARMRKGLTQTELAQGLVTPSMISQIESDKATPSYHLLQGIAERLEVPLEFFLTDFDRFVEQQSTFQLAKSYLAGSNCKAAIECLTRLLRDEPTFIPQAEIRFHLALAYLQLKEWSQARTHFEMVLEDALQQEYTYLAIQCYAHLGTIACQLQEYEIAIHHWKQSYRLSQSFELVDPFETGYIAQCLADVYAKIGNSDLANRYLQESFTWLKPNETFDGYAATYRELAQTCHNRGYYNLAMQYAMTATALNRYSSMMRQVLVTQIQFARQLDRDGKREDAVAALEECAKTAARLHLPDLQWQAYQALAEVMLQHGHYEEARTAVETAQTFVAQDSVEQADSLFLLGTIAQAAGHEEQALQSLQNAVHIYEQHQHALGLTKTYRQLGMMYQEKNESQIAAQYLDKMREMLERSLQERNLIPLPTERFE
jgi:tetratricopeptide (TPR) repeat protein